MFSVFAERFVGHRVTLHHVQAIAFVAFVLAASAGLVALGRWTAPTASTRLSKAAVVKEPCGKIAPATMPKRGCQQALTRIYLGAPADVPCGTVAPPALPSAACQRVLESIYLGTGS